MDDEKLFDAAVRIYCARLQVESTHSLNPDGGSRAIAEAVKVAREIGEEVSSTSPQLKSEGEAVMREREARKALEQSRRAASSQQHRGGRT